MKNIFLSIVAIAAIAACTKSEVQYDAPQKIGFAPVAKNATKAALVENAIPTTGIIVSANAGDAGSNIAACTQPYFSDVTFTQNGSSGVFEAADCYWPNVQHLSFIGVTASAGISASNIEMSVNTNTITISNYAQPLFTEVNNDLMWFPSTTPQGKSNPTIGVEMLHACSWLQFYFKGDGVSGTTTSPWKILSIDILSLSEAETATITGNNIIWSETCTVDAGTKKPYNVYTGTRTDNYSTSQGLELQDCRAGMSGSAVVTAENSVLVIPQTPCDLSVTYQYEIGGNTITEVASASLKYSGTDKWVAGTKYTYYVTIGATPIQIKPVADGWANGSGTLDKVM